MNQTDVIDEYSRRYQFAQICQLLAIPLLLVSISCFWLSGGAFATLGEKILVILGGAFLIAFLAAVIVSVDRYRCPDCFRSLGIVRTIRYCPYCGVNLQSAGDSDLAYQAPGERRGFFGGISEKVFPSAAISPSASARPLPQGNFRPLATDFPDETYPKNIRMFTTSDEMELTKRYIRLISKDETPIPEGAPDAFSESLPVNGRAPQSKPSEDAPRWRNKKKTI
jgi:hypothetical protein